MQNYNTKVLEQSSESGMITVIGSVNNKIVFKKETIPEQVKDTKIKAGREIFRQCLK